jgi:chromosome partitioning protein
MKTIAIMNQKGGVGKTTTAMNLAADLTNRGNKVLIIDLDPQGNLSQTLNQERENNAFDFLQGKLEKVYNTPQGFFIASTPELVKIEAIFEGTGKEYKLAEALEPLHAQFDYCIIDTPPALGLLTTQALTAADYVIVPTQPDIYGINGIYQLMQTVNAVKKYCNQKLKLAGILITRYRASVVKREAAEELERVAERIGTHLFKTRIRECNALFEAPVMKTDIYTHAPKSNAASDYRAFTDELLEAIQ